MAKSNITRKKVNGKIQTYNNGKLIHETDLSTGVTKSYDITKNNKQTTSKNTTTKSTKSNKNADGTWKQQTMVTGSYFGTGSKKQNTVKESTPQIKQTSVSTDKTNMRESIANKNKGKSYKAGEGYVDRGAESKSYSIKSSNKSNGKRESVAEKNKGKVAVAGKGYQDRGSESKSYKITNPEVKAVQEAYVQKNGSMTQAKPMTEEVYGKVRNLQKLQQGVDINDVTNANTQAYLTDLANKETINEVDKREMQGAMDRIREWSWNNMLDYSDPETRASLEVLNSKLEARLNAGTSVGAGLVDAMVPGMDLIKENAENSTKDLLKDTAWGKGTYKNGDPNIDYQKANPIAYSAGQMIGSIITMDVAASAVGTGVSKVLGKTGLEAAVKAGKISQSAANWIARGSKSTGLAAVMTTKDAARKGYDWNNYGTDFLKNALMFNVMDFSAAKIDSALGSLLTKGTKIGSFVFTGGKQFSNKWQTVSKLITAAGSAGAGVASTIPFNTKEENDALLNQWITLTAFQGITSILGGLSAGREQAETAAKGIKDAYRANEAAKDIKGQSETLNRAADGISSAEADYKAAIRAEAEGRAELADQLFDQAGKTAKEVAKMIYGPDSAGMYGVKQSDKEAIMSALDMILESTGNSVNMSSTGAQSSPITPVLPGTTSSPMQLTDGAGVTPTGSETNNIQTPTLDMYAGGKANVDAIIGRRTAPADTMPTIAKYGGTEVANEAAKAANPNAVSTVRAAADVPMISKYAGNETVADEASVAIVSGKIRPQVQDALKTENGEVTINDKGTEVTLPTSESLDLDLITRQEADGTIDAATFTEKYAQIVNTSKIINGIINTEDAAVSLPEEVSNYPAEKQKELQIIANDFSKGIIDEADVITQVQNITKNELPAEIDSDIISETNGGVGYVKGLKYDGSSRPEGYQSVNDIGYRAAGRNAGGSIRELFQSPGKEKAFTRTAEYKRAASEIRDTILYKDKTGNIVKEHYSQVPERFYDEEMNAIVTQNSKIGLKTVFVYNNLVLNGRKCLAALIKDKVYISMSSEYYTLTALNKHEVGHDFIDDNPDLKSTIKNRIIELVGKQKYDEQLQLYKDEELEGYDFTPDDAETEFLCDSLAEVTVLSEAKGFQTIIDEFNKLIDDKIEPGRTTGKISTKLSKKQIEDFGEKIGGARKDVWIKRGLSIEDLDPMNTAEANKYVKKDYVWKKPKYDAMLEEGADKELLFYKKLVRDAIPTTPAYSYLDKTPEQIRAKQEAYIDTVKTIKNWVDNLDSLSDAGDAVNKLLIDKGYIVDNRFSYGFTEKPNGGAITNKLINALGMSDTPSNFARQMQKAQFGVPKDQKIPNGMTIRFNAREGYNLKANTYYIRKGNVLLQTNIATEEEAIRIAQEMAKSSRSGGKQRYIPPRFEVLRRTGVDYRSGKHTTGQNYLDDFDFRGGEFGNWMSEADRQASLDYGYDALSDLADALGVSKSDISFNKWLAIAFGARGQGGRSGGVAHFEPERRVINLTKMRGAGSLGHEWGHGLSQYLGEMFGTSNKELTAHARDYEPMQNVLNAMLYRTPTEAELKEYGDAASKRKSTAIDHFRQYMDRYFPESKMTAEQKQQFDSIMDRLVSLSTDDAYMLNTGGAMLDYKGGALGELSDLRKTAIGRVLGKEIRKEIYSYVYNISRQDAAQVSRVESNYLKNSRAYGKIVTNMGTGYWDSPEEMLARAFACYVTDRLKEKGMINDYLSGHSETNVTTDYDGNRVAAMPEGEERIAINKAFDALFADLKDRGVFTAAELTGEVKETVYGGESNQIAAAGEMVQTEPVQGSKELPGESNATMPEQTMLDLDGITYDTTEPMIEAGIVDQDGNKLVLNGDENTVTKNTGDHLDRLGETANLGEPTVLSNDNVAQTETEVNTTGKETATAKPKLNSKLSKQYDSAVKEFTDNAFNLMNIPNRRAVRAELKAEIEKIAANAFKTGVVNNDAVTDLVSRMWDEGLTYSNYIQDSYPDLKKYFQTTGIKVSDTIKGDIPDYNAWRKSQIGSLNITNNGIPVDILYQELNASYPQLFPEDIINPTDQLLRMAEVRQEMRGEWRSNNDLYSDDQRAEIASMANRLVDTLEKKITGIAAESRGEAIPGYSPENLASLDAQDPLNQDPDWISLQQQEPVVETEGEKLKNWKETKRRVSLTSQVLDMTRRVQKAAKTAQPELRAKMIEEFGTIVPYFKGMSDGKRINLQKQIDDLDRFRRENPGALQYVWDPATGAYKQDDPITRIMTQLNGKLIAEMTNDELYQLFKNGQMLMHQYRTAKKEIREQGAREISDLGETAIKQMETAGPKALKDNDIADFISVRMLSPDTFAKEVDGYAEDGVMQRMFEGIREGQAKYMDFRNRAYDKIEDFNEKHKKFIDKNWRGKKQTVYDTGVVPINGTETLKMTAGERIALYLNSLDYDAMRHMVGGQYRGDDGKMHTYEGKGMTVPNQRLWEKGKLEEAYNAGKNYRVTEKMIQRIIDTMTPEEKEWADLVFKEIYNGICPTEANKVSLALDGWERFIKNNYYRIITDKNYVQTVFESLVNDITVEGQGFTKERQNGANSPILLVDAFNALDSYIDGVAKYIGYAAPMRNITKVLNYSDGTASVKAAINERMGSAGMRYIEKYIADMQGGGKKSRDGRLMSGIRSGYAGSTLTFNPGVVLMQAASIPTAAAYLGWNNMRGIFRKVDGDTVKKYSVYYRYRSKGNYTADFDDLTKNKTMLDRLPMFNWIQQMDNAAVKRLWGACECYVEEHFPNLKKGSEEYLKKVGETLDKCVSLTQPNYTTAERPDVMRTDSDFLKIFTMFKTQPSQNLNLGWSATRNVQYKLKAYNQAKREGRDGKKEKEELKKAWKGLGRTASALTVAAVMIAAIRGVSEMIKGRWDNFTDENGEFSLDGLFNYIGKETGGSLAGSVIGGNELYSFISSLIDENSNYYDISAPQLSVINDFTSALKNMYDVFSAVTSGDRSPKALFRSSEKLAETIGTMFGVPIANVRKYVGGIIGNFSPEFKAEYEDLMYGIDLSDVKSASTQGWMSTMFGGMADFDAQFNKLFEDRNGTGIKTENRDEMKRLFSELYETNGDASGMFLSDPSSYTYNGISYDLKESDKESIRQTAQAEATENINKLMNSKAFQNLSDDQKLSAIKEINSLAAQTAKNEYLSNHNQSVDAGKDFDKVSYALFKASINDDMTTTEKKQKLLDLNFNDYATASVYEKYFEDKSTKEENSIAYKMVHTSKSAAEIIRESLEEKAEKEKTAAAAVENNATTKIKDAEGYELPNYRASTLQAIAEMGISAEDYAYVSDRVDGHDDKVSYIQSLPFDTTTKQALVDDMVMGDKAHSKMQVAEDDYNIPNSTYIETYMFGYESTGTKAERNQKIEDYVNSLPGLNDSQKEYLYWANQVYKKKEAVGSGEADTSSSSSSSSGSKKSSSGRRSSGSSGSKKSSGSGSKKSGSSSTTSPKVSVPSAPSISSKSVSGIAKTSLSKYIASNLKAKTEAQRKADYEAQIKSIESNVFMTAKQKAAAKKRLKAALG